jgi:hypothetical protein
MAIPSVATYQTELEALLAAHATQETILVLVDDIERWAAANHLSVLGNPVGTCFESQGDVPRRIVVREAISEERVNGILGRLDFRGYWVETRSLRSDPAAFLRHLVLHELGHLENNWGQEREDDCDAWAFSRLAT